MVASKPISLTQVNPGSYSGPTPQPYLIVGELPAATLTPAAAVADIATADGSDPATTQALANATKAKVNALLASLRAGGFLAP